MKKISKSAYDHERLRIIFEYSPIPIWEEDFTAVAKLRDLLKARKVKNVREYLLKNQKLVTDAFRQLKVLDVNQAALTLYGAKSKKELLSNLGKTFHTDVLRILVDEFTALIEGKRNFDAEFKSRRLNGKLCDVKIHVSIPEVYKDSLKRGIVSFQDISVQKKYEKHLEKLAQTDGLTKVLNHSAILSRLEEEILRAKRYKVSLSCLMLDLDHFKGINDLCGHQKGDQVLRRTADILKQSLREVDIVGRYGGDEFLIILPETALSKAELVANRLHSLFDKLTKQSDQQQLFSTVSIGVAEPAINEVKSVKEFIMKVDKAMYLAKKKGRNTVAVL